MVYDKIVIVGVGEVGHNIVRLLPPMKTIMIIDGDRVEPHNPSYRSVKPGTPKVVSVLSELREKGYSTFLVNTLVERPGNQTAYGFCGFISPAQTFSPEWLVIECTDRAEMLSLPAVHVHTDVILPDKAIINIWRGAKKIRQREQPGRGCTDLLARAAVVAAQRFVQLFKEGRFPEFPGIVETIEM